MIFILTSFVDGQRVNHMQPGTKSIQMYANKQREITYLYDQIVVAVADAGCFVFFVLLINLIS